ncbi:MAG: hypothetical protein K2P70_07405 [Hyphomonadaceae bacterium]|nr:hypothetical protein [Hyphomonadaceae bacterium]
MTQQGRCNDPKVGPEADHCQANEHHRDRDFDAKGVSAAANDSKQNIVRGDHHHHDGVEGPVSLESRDRSKSANTEPKNNTNDVFHDHSLSVDEGLKSPASDPSLSRAGDPGLLLQDEQRQFEPHAPLSQRQASPQRQLGPHAHASLLIFLMIVCGA